MDIVIFNNYLAAIVRSARLHSNLTQAEVAYRAGVTRRYIQSVENGKQETALSTLFALAEAMEISPAKLVAELENGPSFSLRKKASRVFTLEEYMLSGSITPGAVDLIEDAVYRRLNIVVVGGTSSGKATFVMRSLTPFPGSRLRIAS